MHHGQIATPPAGRRAHARPAGQEDYLPGETEKSGRKAYKPLKATRNASDMQSKLQALTCLPAAWHTLSRRRLSEPPGIVAETPKFEKMAS